jgi:HD-GYP domain-containing protein (c-di-GMP phosphodiesterase class II)
MRARTLLGRLGLGHEAELDPAMAEALERTSEQTCAGLERRERVAEGLLAAATVVGAVALVLIAPLSHHFDPALAVALGTAYAIAQRVRFHDGGGYTAPTQLVFVPMVILLPPSTVPLLVVGFSLAGNLGRVLRGALHPQRALLSVGDGWYALGPALVLAIAAQPEPSWSGLPVYGSALAAQFGFDLVGSVLRDWMAVGLGADLALPLLAWTWLVDGLLSTVGLLAALAARDEPFGSLFVLPLAALLAIFSRERSARIDQSLELSRAYRGTTLLLSDVLDNDDEYTAFHSRGVVQLSIAVADRMDLDARQRRNVEFGALLHDVGKIAIPKEILNKPGKLSADEWVVMETHTVEGQRLLDRVGGVLGEVGQIVRSSHERWDGGGYPDGLAAQAIPVEATIVCACDAFNAMTTDRPYRRALPLETAMAELRDNAGTQFSPHVVAVLIELIEEHRAMPARERLEDEITLVLPPELAVESLG